MPSAPAITLELRSSRIERRLGVILVLAAAASLALASWPLPVRAIAVATLLSCVAIAIGSRAPVAGRVTWGSDGRWWLQSVAAKPGEIAAVAETPVDELILRGHHVAGPVIALYLVPAGTATRTARLRRRRTLVLWPDSADADALRRLRIRLARLQPDEESSRPLDGVG